MIQRQFARGQDFSAILAGIAIAQQDVLPRQRPRLMRNSAVLEQPDYRRHTQSKPRRMQKVAVFLFRHRHALQHQHNRTARSAYVDRFVGSVQHQHRRVQRMGVALLMNADTKHRSRDGVPPVVCSRIVPVY